MTEHPGELLSVKIIPNDKGNPPGKLADAEVVFEADAGPLSGLKLIGFSVWDGREGGRNVTFPARQYSVNGERRSFALLRPSKDDRDAQAIRECILEAYSRIEAPSSTLGCRRAHARRQRRSTTTNCNDRKELRWIPSLRSLNGDLKRCRPPRGQHPRRC